MLIIRLQRVGKKNEPTFRVVLTDSKNSTKSGKFLEILGSYDARDKNETRIDGDRAKYWISKGAKLSDTVHNLLINKKIISGKKINVLPKKSPIKKENAEGPAESKKIETPVEVSAEIQVEKPSESQEKESPTEKPPVSK